MKARSLFLSALLFGSLGAAALWNRPAPQPSGHQGLVAAATPKGKIAIEGLVGGSKITIRNYSWGIRNTTSGGAAGSATGKATFDQFTVEKLVDDLSPALAEAAAEGIHFPSVTVKLYEPGTTIVRSIFTIPDITVGAVSHNYKSLNVENVSFNYGEIDWVYRADGGDKNFCFDLALNASC